MLLTPDTRTCSTTDVTMRNGGTRYHKGWCRSTPFAASGQHGLIDSSDNEEDGDEEDDDDIPLGLNRTPPRASHNLSYNDSHSHDNALNYSPPSQAFPSSPAHSPLYVPPSGDLLQQQVRRVQVAADSTPPRPPYRPATGGLVMKQSRRVAHEDLKREAEKETLDYERGLSALRSEQKKRQQSQLKEFADSEKYREQCEQYHRGLCALVDGLGSDLRDLNAATEELQAARRMRQEVFFEQLEMGAKVTLDQRVDAAERALLQRKKDLGEVQRVLEEHKDRWVKVGSLEKLLQSSTLQELRKGHNQRVLFLDRVLETLRRIDALVTSDQLDSECMTYLRNLKVPNVVTYDVCNKSSVFRSVVSLDSTMPVASIEALLATITSASSNESFGELGPEVDRKVSQFKKQVSLIEQIFAEVSQSDVVEEMSDNLKESLQGEEVAVLRTARSSDVLLLDKVLLGLGQVLRKESVSEINQEVVQFLREKNESILSSHDPAITSAASTSEEDGSFGLLGPDVSELSSVVESVLHDMPEEHRVSCQECLLRCLELAECLKQLAARDKIDLAEGKCKDRRNERRREIGLSIVYLQHRVDGVTGKTKRSLFSQIFQLVISIAATSDIMTIIELSAIPSCLCLGSIERSRIFHEVVKKASPVCAPQLKLSSPPFEKSQRVRVVGLLAAQVAFSIDLNTLIGLSEAGLELLLEEVWRWFVSCGHALSHASKSSQGGATDTLGEICDAVKLFLDIAGAVLLDFLGPRFRQLLEQPLRSLLAARSGKDEKSVTRLLSLLEGLQSTGVLACVSDMFLLTPFACFARVKKCEWSEMTDEWKRLVVSLKRECTDVKKIVGRAFNQLGTDTEGLKGFQKNMGTLKQMPAMQNLDLRSKVLFFLSDKALSTCSDMKVGTTGGVQEDVNPLATAFVWLLGSQRGMSDIFLKGLCSYCPFVYQMSLAVSEDDAVNLLELGYPSEQDSTASKDKDRSEKWKKRTRLLLAFYASLLVKGHEVEASGGTPLRHFTLRDAWMWLARMVNFCMRNKDDGLPSYVLWILETFLNIVANSLLASEYRDHFLRLLQILRSEVLPAVLCQPSLMEYKQLSALLVGVLGQ